MVDYFLPGMRAAIAHELAERGQSQSKIALELGITQARVSHYLANKKGSYYAQLSKHFGIDQEELEGYTRILADDVTRSQIDGIFTLYSIWKNMLFNGAICGIHQRESLVAKDCSVCMDLHRPSKENQLTLEAGDEQRFILHELSQAVSIIENSPTFPEIMPQVSVNIAMCKAVTKSKGDVAAIPGRICKIHGRARAFVLPEFGSSNHMSKVLTLFHARSSRIRAVMNLRYDELLDQCLHSLSVPKLTTKYSVKQNKRDGTAEQGPADQIVLLRLATTGFPGQGATLRIPFAVVDPGSAGLEPITYLFGTNATELAHLALRISDEYVKMTSEIKTTVSD
jgi:predicted fused transcriptional regulator/phosphomethylpyrimidine kinase/predicted transcriptional regulator